MNFQFSVPPLRINIQKPAMILKRTFQTVFHTIVRSTPETIF